MNRRCYVGEAVVQRKSNWRLAPGGGEATGRRKASVLTDMLYVSVQYLPGLFFLLIPLEARVART